MLSRHCLVSMTHIPGLRGTLGWLNQIPPLCLCLIWAEPCLWLQRRLPPRIPPERKLNRPSSNQGRTLPNSQHGSHSPHWPHRSPRMTLSAHSCHAHAECIPRDVHPTSIPPTADQPPGQLRDGSSGRFGGRYGFGTGQLETTNTESPRFPGRGRRRGRLDRANPQWRPQRGAKGEDQWSGTVRV